MIPIVERGFNHWMIPIAEINVHQVGILPLVEIDFHQCILPLVERNMHQGLPFVESGDQRLPLVESGNQGRWIQASTFAFLLWICMGG